MVLAIEGLSKTYEQYKAVDEVSLQVDKGQVFGLLGPNGSGKTSTLGMILGVIRPSSGSYRWFNDKRHAQQRRRVGSLLERPQFSPWLTAEKNLEICALIRGIKDVQPAISRVLKQVHLYSERNKKFSGFSLGMKQRLAIASAMMGEPEVLVLDEPTNGIDAQGIIEIRQLIIDFAAAGKTVILASHILDEVEKVCTHVAVLKQGRVLQSGSIKNVLTVNDSIEVASSDMDTLEKALKSCSDVLEIIRKKTVFQLHVNTEFAPKDLNSYLVKQNIFVDHLMLRKKSLEAHFLELLGNNP